MRGKNETLGQQIVLWNSREDNEGKMKLKLVAFKRQIIFTFVVLVFVVSAYVVFAFV